MKGLIYKDLVGLKQVGISMVLLMCFYLAMGFVSGSDDGQNNYFSIMAMVIGAMVPITCAAYDEQCGWDSFGAALPVNRAKIVMSRYVLSIIVNVASLVIIFVADVILKIANGHKFYIISYLYYFVAPLLYVSIINPMLYKFGVQKGRIIALFAILVPVFMLIACLILFASNRNDKLIVFIGMLIEAAINQKVAMTVIIFIFTVAIYVLSMLLSIRIYKKKDL